MKDSRSLRLQLKQQRVIDRRDGSGFRTHVGYQSSQFKDCYNPPAPGGNTATVCCLATALILIHLSGLWPVDVVLFKGGKAKMSENKRRKMSQINQRVILTWTAARAC